MTGEVAGGIAVGTGACLGFGVVGAVVKGFAFVVFGFDPVASSRVINGFFGDTAVVAGFGVAPTTKGLAPVPPATLGSTAGLSGTDGKRCARISAART